MLLLGLILGLALQPAGAGQLIQAESPDPRAWTLAVNEQRAIEEELSNAVRRLVSKQPRLLGQKPPVGARVTLVPSERVVMVELGAGYVPSEWSADFEEANHAIYLLVAETLQDIYPVKGVHFTYGGRTLDHYFPENFHDNESDSKRKVRAGSPGETVTVSPGHGKYFR